MVTRGVREDIKVDKGATKEVAEDMEGIKEVAEDKEVTKVAKEDTRGDKEGIKEEAEDMGDTREVEGDIKVVEAVDGCRELTGELVEGAEGVVEEVDTAEEKEEEDTDMFCLHCFSIKYMYSSTDVPKDLYSVLSPNRIRYLQTVYNRIGDIPIQSQVGEYNISSVRVTSDNTTGSWGKHRDQGAPYPLRLHDADEETENLC